jgi:putative ABC transport system substrate-binding protein
MCLPHLPAIVQNASEKKIPTVAMLAGAENEILLTVSASTKEQGTVVAKMSRMILGGVKVSDIPPQDPEQVETVINLKVADSIGLVVPEKVISSATRVIK